MKNFCLFYPPKCLPIRHNRALLARLWQIKLLHTPVFIRTFGNFAEVFWLKSAFALFHFLDVVLGSFRKGVSVKGCFRWQLYLYVTDFIKARASLDHVYFKDVSAFGSVA